MNHSYSSIKNMQDLDDEIEKSKIRSQILKEELKGSLYDVRESVSFGGAAISSILGIFSILRSKGNHAGNGKMGKFLAIAAKFSGLMSIFNAFKKK